MLRLVPKGPYHIEPLDVVQVVVTGTLAEQPISGQYAVDSSGKINLGPTYGSVHIVGLTKIGPRAYAVVTGTADKPVIDSVAQPLEYACEALKIATLSMLEKMP